MKLLHVIASTDLEHGGPIAGVVQIGAALRAAGHEQEVLSLDPPDAPWLATSPLTVHALGPRTAAGRGPVARMRRYVRYSPGAVRWLRRHARDYDGVIVDGLWNYATRVARKVLPGSGVPYVVFSHGMLAPLFASYFPLKHRLKSVLWRFNEGVLLRNAAAVAFTCERERLQARTSFQPWGMREAVVGLGTSAPDPQSPEMVPAFRRSLPALRERPYILYLGRLTEVKGCSVAIRAFAEIAGESPETDLVMAGPATPDSFSAYGALAESLGVADRVHFPGMVSGPAKWGALYDCSALLLPSHHENFGVVIVEAMACGKPVLISNEVNISEEVGAAGAGLVAPDTVAGTVASLRRLLAMPEIERIAMGERGRALFAARYEIGGTADALVRIFTDAAAGRFARQAPE